MRRTRVSFGPSDAAGLNAALREQARRAVSVETAVTRVSAGSASNPLTAATQAPDGSSSSGATASVECASPSNRGGRAAQDGTPGAGSGAGQSPVAISPGARDRARPRATSGSEVALTLDPTAVNSAEVYGFAGGEGERTTQQGRSLFSPAET